MNNAKNNKYFIPLIVFTIIFYIATVLPHEIVGGAIGSLFKDASRATYDRTMLIILASGIFLYSIFILRSLLKHRSRMGKGLLYIVVTIILSAMAMKYLVVINVEAVHFLQYGALAVLVFHLVKRYDYTCAIIFLLALLDEGYQHFFLTPNRFAYLDFNDIMLDIIGAGFGLSSMYCLNKSSDPINKTLRNSILSVYGTLVLASVVLYMTGTMRIWPTEGEPMAPIQIFHKPMYQFWTTVRKVVQFHIMRPLEGLLVIFATMFFYSRLDD